MFTPFFLPCEKSYLHLVSKDDDVKLKIVVLTQYNGKNVEKCTCAFK